MQGSGDTRGTLFPTAVDANLLVPFDTGNSLWLRTHCYTIGLEGYVPPFSLNVLHVLQILVLHISTELDRIIQWLTSIFAVFPSYPRLLRLEFTFYVEESEDIDDVFAFCFLNWKSLVEDRYPSLKVLEFEMMMESRRVWCCRKEARGDYRSSEHVDGELWSFSCGRVSMFFMRRLLIDQTCLL